MLMYNIKMLFYETMNSLVFFTYMAFDTSLVTTSTIIKIIGAIVFALYFLNQIRWRIVRPHYGGSWKKWMKDWFGLKGGR